MVIHVVGSVDAMMNRKALFVAIRGCRLAENSDA